MLRPFAVLGHLWPPAILPVQGHGGILTTKSLSSARRFLAPSPPPPTAAAAVAATALPFSTTPAVQKKQLPPRPKPPPESEIEETFVKGSGPGGQKIVRLPHHPIYQPTSLPTITTTTTTANPDTRLT